MTNKSLKFLHIMFIFRQKGGSIILKLELRTFITAYISQNYTKKLEIFSKNELEMFRFLNLNRK